MTRIEVECGIDENGEMVFWRKGTDLQDCDGAQWGLDNRIDFDELPRYLSLVWDDDPQGEQDEPREPPTVNATALLGGYAEMHYQEDHAPLLERIAALEAWKKTFDDHAVHVQGIFRELSEPPAPAEPKVVDLDALEKRVWSVIKRYAWFSLTQPEVKAELAQAFAAAKEASRET